MGSSSIKQWFEFDSGGMNSLAADPSGARFAYLTGDGDRPLRIHSLEGVETTIRSADVPASSTFPLVWHPDGERLFFHRSTDTGATPDIGSVMLDGEVTTVVPEGGKVVDIFDDGQSLLLSRSEDEQHLARYSLDSRTIARVVAYDGGWKSVGVSPGGERLAYTTVRPNSAHDEIHIASFPEAGQDITRIPGKFVEWSSDGGAILTDRGVYELGVEQFEDLQIPDRDEILAFLPDETGILAKRHHDGGTRTSIVVYNRDGSAARKLAVPDGVHEVPDWTGTAAFLESGLLLVHLSATTRRRLIWYDLRADSYEEVLSNNGVDIDTDRFVEPEYIRYESSDGLEIGALLYDSGARPSPALVMVHGGPFTHFVRTFDPEAQLLAEHGFTVLQPNYRGSTGQGEAFRKRMHGDIGGGDVADIASGGRWLASKDWIDEDGIAAYGGSYGGFNVLLQLANNSDLWAAGLTVNAANIDLFEKAEEANQRFELALGDPDENPELFRERSPIHNAEKIDVPVLLIAGEEDPAVSQARRLRDALSDRLGADFEYHEFADRGHSIGGSDKVRMWELTLSFLDEHVR